MEKTKIILDCDPGHDDAVAITLAANSDKIDLLGITVVAGNQTLEKTQINARNVCQWLGVDVPVYAGCGQPMVHDDKERMMRCPDCGMMEFPKICPAVIIAVTHGDKILMSKYAGREYKKYALLAGFNETGESIEETVRREVMEEVGLKVKNLRYYKSQPWSFSDTILMGFYCDLDGEEEITLDREELALAEWFRRDEIPVEPSRDSLTNEMIIKFKNGEV